MLKILIKIQEKIRTYYSGGVIIYFIKKLISIEKNSHSDKRIPHGYDNVLNKIPKSNKFDFSEKKKKHVKLLSYVKKVYLSVRRFFCCLLFAIS